MKTFKASPLRRYRALFGCGLLAWCVAAGHPRAAQAKSLIYVSLEEGGEVVAIDPDTGTIEARVPVGKRPRGIKVSPNGKLLFVALSGSPRAAPGVDESKLPPGDRAADGIGIVDLTTHKLLRTIQSGQDPEAFDVSRDGKTLYVSNEETAEMSVVDVASGVVKHKVPVGGEPEGVTLSPNGKLVYVTSETDSIIAAIATDKLTVVGRMPVGPRPRSVAFTHDGKTAFATSENGAQLTVLDVAKNAPTGTIKIVAQAKTVLGPRPMGTALSPDGKTLYVSCGRGESVAVVDVASRQVTHLFDGIGARPWGIGVSHDGKTLFTANGPSNDVSIVDVATGKVTSRVKVGGLPWGLVVAPEKK